MPRANLCYRIGSGSQVKAVGRDRVAQWAQTKRIPAAQETLLAFVPENKRKFTFQPIDRTHAPTPTSTPARRFR